MNSKKTSPPSSLLPPARAGSRVAATLVSGGQTAQEPAKDEAKEEVKRADTDPEKLMGPATQDGYPMGSARNAVVQDFVGAALLMLPPALRTFLGDAALVASAFELATQEILVIVREEGTVAYVHLPILVMEMEKSGAGLREGLTLRDITGTLGKATTAQAGQAKTRTKTKAPKAGATPQKRSAHRPPKPTTRRSHGQ